MFGFIIVWWVTLSLIPFSLIDSLFLWLGATVAQIENCNFGKVFLAEIVGVISSFIASYVSGTLVFSILSGINPEFALSIGILWIVSAFFIVFIWMVKLILSTTWSKAIIACLISLVVKIIVAFIMIIIGVVIQWLFLYSLFGII